ncbi:unnamed protein product [Linum trigynum]|uniref:Uncharacterized protein n=1 Tax=Linum trigynum TaxID=586398 RepID=A0AAV2FGS3_9ROSI
MASNNSQPSASVGGAPTSKKGKEKASSSKVRKMVDQTVYRRSKWRLAEIASDIEDDQSYTRLEALTEDDTSSVDPDPGTSCSRTVTDSGYTILPWRGMWGGEAPPSSARLLGPDKRPSIQLHRVVSYIRGLGYPTDWGYAVPDGSARIGSCPEGWFAIYSEYLKCGLKFPLDPILSGILEMVGCPLSFLSPSLIFHTCAFRLICKRLGYIPSFSIFRSIYALERGKHGWSAVKRDSKYQGRVCKGSPKLPSKWYCSYFFIRPTPGTWHAPTSAPLSTLWGEGSEETWAKDFTLAKPEREQKHHILRAPPVDFGRKGERARALGELYDHDFDYSSLAKMAKKIPGASGVRAQKAAPRSSGKASDDIEEASPRLFPSLGSRDPLPEKTLGKRHASADSPVAVPKKKNKPSLGSIDEILAPPRSRRAVKPKEPVPISPSAALNAPSAFTSAVELRKFLKLPLDEGTSPAGSACQHLFQAMLDVVALSDKSAENRDRAHKNFLQASQLKTDKITLQGVNSRLEDELASVKRQLSDALAAESVSAREEKEKEIAFQAKRIEALEKELLAMSAARGHQKEEFKKRLIKEREDAVDAHLSSAEFREWQQNLLLGVKKRAFIGIRKKVRSDNPGMKWDTPEVWQAMDDYFLSLGTDNEPSDSYPYPLDEGDSSADDVGVDVERVGEEGVGDNVDANAGAGEGGGDMVAVDGEGDASDGGTDGDSSSSDNHSSKSD